MVGRYGGRYTRVSSQRAHNLEANSWKDSRTRKWPFTCANTREQELFADGVHLNINGRVRSPCNIVYNLDFALYRPGVVARGLSPIKYV